MNIRVLFFASIKEQLGRSELFLDLPNPQSAEALWQALSADREALPRQILVAVNHEYVHADYQLRDGDVVAFFPPVTGG